MLEIKETAKDMAAVCGKLDEIAYYLKHIHYLQTFGDQIKDRKTYYDDFSAKNKA